jgi:hypothetical protein
MNIALKILLAISGMAVACCTFYYFFLFFRRPVEFYKRNHPSKSKFFRRTQYISTLLIVGTWIGLGTCVFRGCTLVLFWVPRSRVVQEDWIVYSLAGFVAFFGACLTVQEMGTFNTRLVEGSMTRDTLREDERSRQALDD